MSNQSIDDRTGPYAQCCAGHGTVTMVRLSNHVTRCNQLITINVTKLTRYPGRSHMTVGTPDQDVRPRPPLMRQEPFPEKEGISAQRRRTSFFNSQEM